MRALIIFYVYHLDYRAHSERRFERYYNVYTLYKSSFNFFLYHFKNELNHFVKIFMNKNFNLFNHFVLLVVIVSLTNQIK